MEPQLIQDLAIWDPIAAYGMLLQIPRVPIAMSARATFSSLSVPQPVVKGALDTTIATRTWIDNMSFDLSLPNAFSGQVFQTMYMSRLREHPGIEVRMVVYSGPKYVISINNTPISNLVNQFASRWPRGWCLYKQQQIGVDFDLIDPPTLTSPNGPPYSITLTFNGWQFLDPSLDDMGADVAAAQLRKMGFCVPDLSCLRRVDG
jgi:hypothetical protein